MVKKRVQQDLCVFCKSYPCECADRPKNRSGEDIRLPKRVEQ